MPSAETKKIWSEQRAGKKAKTSTRQLMSDQRSGDNNPNSLAWTITDPTGKSYSIKALRAWCRDNNYNYRTVYHSLNGWIAVKHGQGRGGKKKVNND